MRFHTTPTQKHSADVTGGRERPEGREDQTALMRRAEVKSEVNYLALLTKGEAQQIALSLSLCVCVSLCVFFSWSGAGHVF